jgi:alpha-beta hydrolase superfamily lysophospholipase
MPITAADASSRRTFVLVHGTSHGGWCWRRVADLLQARGHKVYTPTLTGLADRSHLMSKDITLDTHILDVVNLLKWEGLEDVCLCGHSSGGVVISGAIEQVLPQVSSIVFLDAFLPENGQRPTDWNSPHARAAIAAALENGAISRPPVPSATYNINERDRAWVDAQATPQPIGVSLQPIRLTGARDRVAKKAYIRATGYPHQIFDRNYARTKADPAWRTYAVPCGHVVMLDMPERLAEILQEVA